MTYKILHLIDTTGPGGAEDVFIELADRIRSDRVSSVVVIRGEGYVATTLRKKGLEPIILDSKGSFNLGFIKQMCRIVKANKINLIQSHLLGSNVYASIIGLLTRRPVVATYHGMVDVAPNERFKALKLAFMRHGISHFVAVSQSLKNKIMQNRLLVPEKTSVIYNGINTEAYSTAVQHTLRQQLGLPESTFLFGALGNIRKSKRYDLLVEAVAILKKKNIDVAVVIAGDPKAALRDALDKQIEQAGITNIHFIGFVDDTPDYLANLDGFVLSSDAEGFSISTIEAMATGLPLVATKCGGPQEIISSSQQGMLVDVSAEAIARGMASVIESVRQKNAVRNEAAVARVKSSFSIDAMVAAYQQCYERADKRIPAHLFEQSGAGA
mgnify:CR=1 FL=1